jgi:thioredoxin 1
MSLTVDQTTFSHEVLGASVPVLVSFWAPWCGVCRMVSPMLLDLQTQWQGQIKLVSINADENLKLANTYRLKTLPTLILFDRGSVQCRFEDFQNRNDFHKAAQNLHANLESLLLQQGCSAPV